MYLAAKKLGRYHSAESPTTAITRPVARMRLSVSMSFASPRAVMRLLLTCPGPSGSRRPLPAAPSSQGLSRVSSEHGPAAKDAHRVWYPVAIIVHPRSRLRLHEASHHQG